MNKVTPFFYVIENTLNGMLYAGSKWGNGADPSTFMLKNGYQTSSGTIKSIIKNFGLNIFKIRKIRIFNAPIEAYNYETKFLKKVNARNNPRFYNGCNNEWFSEETSNFGTENFKQKIKDMYGNHIENISQTEYWKKTVPQKLKNKPKSEEHKRNMRKPRSDIGKENISKGRIKATKENPEKFSKIAAKGGAAGKGKKKSEEWKHKKSLERRKTYIINNSIIVEHALTYCKENNLSYGKFLGAARYNIEYNSMKIEVLK